MTIPNAFIAAVSLAMLCLILANLIERNEERNIDYRVEWTPDEEPETGRFI